MYFFLIKTPELSFSVMCFVNRENLCSCPISLKITYQKATHPKFSLSSRKAAVRF